MSGPGSFRNDNYGRKGADGAVKIKDGFIVRSVAGKNVVIAVGEASHDFKSMIKLNDTALEIWNGLSEGLSGHGIAVRITEKYDVDIERAEADVRNFLAGLAELGVTE